MTIFMIETESKKNITWEQDCKDPRLIVATEKVGEHDKPAFTRDEGDYMLYFEKNSTDHSNYAEWNKR